MAEEPGPDLRSRLHGPGKGEKNDTPGNGRSRGKDRSRSRDRYPGRGMRSGTHRGKRGAKRGRGSVGHLQYAIKMRCSKESRYYTATAHRNSCTLC